MALRVNFDARMIAHSGIGTYSRSLLRLLTATPELDFTLFGDLAKLANYPAKKVLAEFPIYSLREQVLLPALLNRHPAELLHCPHYNAPLGWRGRLIVTIHDLIHLKFPRSRPRYWYARAMLEAVCRKAALILTVSQNTQRDLLELLAVPEAKIRVIPIAAGAEFANAASATAAIAHQPVAPYLLFVSNLLPHKNLPILVEAFESARKKVPDLRLTIVGKDSTPEYTRSLAGREEIRFLKEINLNQLPQTYRSARIFVFPSLYEGFGLPPLEAMACGTPVLCSNAASLPEVVGDAAVLFDPRDAAGLAEEIVALWNDEGRRRALSRRGLERVKQFSWERAAAATHAAYREATGRS